MSVPTLDAALRQAMARGLDRLDAQWLLLHALGRPLDERAWLLAHGDDPLAAEAFARFADLCAQRLDQVPLAYLTGRRGFHGLELQVDARVLDPRPDTETLVDWALQIAADHRLPDAARVADLGTGSGAIALALAGQQPRWQVHAVDASDGALAVARGNAQRLGLPVTFHAGSWWAPLQGLSFDLVLSNPPYIPTPDLAGLMPEVIAHEPARALDGGTDGLEAYRRICAALPELLAPGGVAVLEVGIGQARDVAALAQARGLTHPETRPDLAGIPRAVVLGA